MVIFFDAALYIILEHAALLYEPAESSELTESSEPGFNGGLRKLDTSFLRLVCMCVRASMLTVLTCGCWSPERSIGEYGPGRSIPRYSVRNFRRRFFEKHGMKEGGRRVLSSFFSSFSSYRSWPKEKLSLTWFDWESLPAPNIRRGRWVRKTNNWTLSFYTHRREKRRRGNTYMTVRKSRELQWDKVMRRTTILSDKISPL